MSMTNFTPADMPGSAARADADSGSKSAPAKKAPAKSTTAKAPVDTDSKSTKPKTPAEAPKGEAKTPAEANEAAQNGTVPAATGPVKSTDATPVADAVKGD